jgi:hypothetical protein
MLMPPLLLPLNEPSPSRPPSFSPPELDPAEPLLAPPLPLLLAPPLLAPLLLPPLPPPLPLAPPPLLPPEGLPPKPGEPDVAQPQATARIDRHRALLGNGLMDAVWMMVPLARRVTLPCDTLETKRPARLASGLSRVAVCGHA